MTTVIIGAGAGGLAAAIKLSASGEKVIVLERQAGAGGKLLPVHFGDLAVDSGPTVLTMRWVFDEIFAHAGETPEDRLQLQPLSVLARHYWTGGATLDLFADQKATSDAIGRFAGRAEANGYDEFAKASAQVHRVLLGPFLKSQRPTPWSLSAAMPLRDMMKINPFETLWHATGRYFKDPRLRQLFGRYATYCGSSPFKSPATLMLIADVEASGVWRIKGGMGELAKALQRTATSCGAAFYFNTTAARLEFHNSRISAVIDDKGTRHACTCVIVNADSAALAQGLLGPDARRGTKPVRDHDRSLSAITWCGLMRDQGVPLDHHTVFFSDSYETEFADLATGPAQDPTVYICDQEQNRKLVLINTPANDKTAPDNCDINLRHRLARSGFSLQFEEGNVLRRDAAAFAALYPATQGALYGRASHGWLSTFQRPQARCKIPGLYLAGGAVHPGPGVPMAALSGLRAAEALLQDRTSMPLWQPMVIAGGMLTP